MTFLPTRFSPRAGMVIVLLVVVWAGARSLTVDTIWYDEWYSLYYAGAAPYYGPITISQTVERALQYNEYNPPGYYVALNIWGQLAGWTPFAARTFSLLVGLVTIAGVYRLGCYLAGATAGLGAGIGLGASAFFIHQLHELRMYTLFTLLITLTLLAYWHYRYQKPDVRAAVVFFFSLLGLLYTHYMALPLVISLALYHLLSGPKNRTWWIISLMAVGCGVLYLPWLRVAVDALGVVSGEGARNFYANDALTLVNNVLIQFSNGSVPLVIIAGWYALGSGKRNVLFVFGLVVGTLGLVVVLNERLRFISIARYLIALWPVLALGVGLGMQRMRQLNVYPLLLMVIWCAAGIGLVAPRTLIAEPKDPHWAVTLPWNRVAQTLDETFFGRAGDEDTFVFLLPQPTPYWFHAPLADYYLHTFHPEVDNMPDWLHLTPRDSPRLRVHLVESLETTTPDQFAGESETVVANTQRVWMAYTPAMLPSPFTRGAWDTVLAQQGFAACTPFIQESTLQMTLYTRIPPRSLTLQFGEGIQLGVLDSALQTGHHALSLLLGWSIAPDVPANTYSVGIYVDDAQGQPVAQTDFGIPGQSSSCSRVSIPLAGIPAGRYRLSSAVYNWQTGERLGGRGADGVAGDRLDLIPFVIPDA